METLSVMLVNKFLQKNIIDPTKTEIYKTGIMLILADIINFSLILIIGLIIKSFIFSIIYLVVFWVVRQHSGGFHAKTYSVCRVVTIGTFILIVIIGKCINQYDLAYVLLCNTITCITMLLFAPVKHPNKKLTVQEVNANKLFALITTFFFSALSITLTVLHKKEGLIVALTLFAVTVLMYIGIVANKRREVVKNVQNV